MLPVIVSDVIAGTIADRASHLASYGVEIDLETCRLRDGRGIDESFTIDEGARHRLLHGLDDIALILQHEDEIAAYEAANA